MCRLIETFQVLDGRFLNGECHEERMNRSRRELFGIGEAVDLSRLILVPEQFREGRVKGRIVYSQEIHSVEFAPYLPRRIRSLRMVESDITYDYKFEDRKALEELRRHRGGADEVLIVKNGLVTDTTFSNIVFYDGATWLTPVVPLLRGTRRRKLLHDGIIREEEIRPQDLFLFKKASLINALLDLGETEMPVENIC